MFAPNHIKETLSTNTKTETNEASSLQPLKISNLSHKSCDKCFSPFNGHHYCVGILHNIHRKGKVVDHGGEGWQFIPLSRANANDKHSSSNTSSGSEQGEHESEDCKSDFDEKDDENYGDDAIPRQQLVETTRWTSEHSDPTKHIYTEIAVRKHFKESLPLVREMIWKCEYVISSNNRCKIYDEVTGRRVRPATSRHYTVISAHAIRKDHRLPPVDYQHLKTRVYESIVHGHSQTKSPADVKHCIEALMNEYAIVKHLQAQGHNIANIPESMRSSQAPDGPAIHIRFTKGFGAYHDCESSVAFLIGETNAMIEMAASMTSKNQSLLNKSVSMMAGGFIAVPLTCFMRTTIKDAYREIIKICKSTPNIMSIIEPHLRGGHNVEFHKQLIINLLEGLRGYRSTRGATTNTTEGKLWANEPCLLSEDDKKFIPWLSSPNIHKDPSELSILLPIWSYEKDCEIGIPSGKRWLSETPLEGCVRYTMEKTGIDLSKAHIRCSAQNRITQETFSRNNQEWMVVLHMEMALNCYVFTHRSMYL